MAKRFVFFYLMEDRPEAVRDTVPAHVAYWRDTQVDGYEGGPFADRSGGLITFEAEGLPEASAIADRDPFVTQRLLRLRWVKEWLPGGSRGG